MGAPLRIGMDGREPLRAEPRGIGQYGRNILRAMLGECDDVEFVLYHEEALATDPSREEFVGPRARPVQVTARGYRWRTWERLAIPWRIRRDGLDAYHGVYNTIPPRLPLLGGPPLIVSIHDVIVTWYDDDLQDPYVQYCRKATPRFLRQASKILTVSEFSRQDIASRYSVDPASIEVIHNGVHDAFLAEVDEQKATDFRTRVTGGKPYIYAIGAHLERKNTGAMIDVLGRLAQDRDFGHDLVITGLPPDQQGPFRARAQAAGVEDRVHLLGYLARHELVSAFVGADLFAYPSKAEGWGVPVVESMAVGTPVATSNTTAIPEAGGEFALYFDPEDLDSMTEVTARALSDRSWFEQRREASMARARGFTWAAAAQKMLRVYREVAARGR